MGFNSSCERLGVLLCLLPTRIGVPAPGIPLVPGRE